MVLAGHLEWAGLVWGAFLLSLLFGIGASLDAVQNAARQQKVVAWHQAVTPWLRSLFAFGLIVGFGARTGNALLGFVIGSAVVLASQVLLFWRKIVRAFAPRGAAASDVERLMSQMRGYAWPFATWGVLTWLQMSSDRWAPQTFQNVRSVGIYAMLYQLGYGRCPCWRHSSSNSLF